MSKVSQNNDYVIEMSYELDSGSASGSGSGSSVTFETQHMCFGSTAISDIHTYYICLVSDANDTTQLWWLIEWDRLVYVVDMYFRL